jgi:hypothetical protein
LRLFECKRSKKGASTAGAVQLVPEALALGISHNPGGREAGCRLEERKMDLATKDQQDSWNALERLLRIASKDTGRNPGRQHTFCPGCHRMFSSAFAETWSFDVGIEK